jgi:cytochrome c oxidase assembly protein subunit 15
MTMAAGSRMRQALAQAAWLGCALMALIIVTSAYLRLRTIGIGCEDWPQCYGRIAAMSDEGGVDAMWVARLLHRLAAMSVALLAVFILAVSFFRSARTLTNVLTALAITALTALLALIGRQSAGNVVPLIGAANLLGGFALLALFGGLRVHNAAGERVRPRGRWLLLGVSAMLVLQIGLGALVSLTYSAPACSGVFECATRLATAPPALLDLPLSAPLALDAQRRVVAPAGAAEAQLLHRVAGIALGALLVLLGAWLARQHEHRRYGLWLVLAAGTEVLLGVAMVLGSFPLWAASLHNAVAAVLLVLTLSIAFGHRRARRGG